MWSGNVCSRIQAPERLESDCLFKRRTRLRLEWLSTLRLRDSIGSNISRLPIHGPGWRRSSSCLPRAWSTYSGPEQSTSWGTSSLMVWHSTARGILPSSERLHSLLSTNDYTYFIHSFFLHSSIFILRSPFLVPYPLILVPTLHSSFFVLYSVCIMPFLCSIDSLPLSHAISSVRSNNRDSFEDFRRNGMLSQFRLKLIQANLFGIHRRIFSLL